MDQIIKIRVSADDKAAFELTAERSGLTLSAWCRTVLKATSNETLKVLRMKAINEIMPSLLDPPDAQIFKRRVINDGREPDLLTGLSLETDEEYRDRIKAHLEQSRKDQQL